LNRYALESWIRSKRPNAEIRWANEKSLLVGASRSGYFNDYHPSFAVNLGKIEGTPEEEFENLHFGTQLRSPEPISLAFVNELNEGIRFVRHAVYQENSVLVMLDMAENSAEVTEAILEKYFFFFDEAVKRLKEAFPS